MPVHDLAHDDYHQPGDDADKIDAHKTARVVRLVLRLLEEAQRLELAGREPQPDAIGDEDSDGSEPDE
jgi:hypothetical protein